MDWVAKLVQDLAGKVFKLFDCSWVRNLSACVEFLCYFHFAWNLNIETAQVLSIMCQQHPKVME